MLLDGKQKKKNLIGYIFVLLWIIYLQSKLPTLEIIKFNDKLDWIICH